MEPIKFNSVAEVEAWVLAHSEAELHLSHSIGHFERSRETDAYIEAWRSVSIERRFAAGDAETRRKEDAALVLRMREINAAEDSAKAALDSAASARASKWLAIFSSVVAVVATVVAVLK